MRIGESPSVGHFIFPLTIVAIMSLAASRVYGCMVLNEHDEVIYLSVFMSVNSTLSLEGYDNIDIHYAETLREWRRRFNDNIEIVKHQVRSSSSSSGRRR